MKNSALDNFFDDLKIVELAGVLAGPSVGVFFSELGANVLKVENKLTGGDVTRNWKLPSEAKDKLSAYYSSINYRKDVMLADFKNDTDLQFIKEKIAQADVVITNFKPGSGKKYGLDYESLKAANPKLIYASLKGFEFSKRPAFDVVLQAECGYMYMNGTPDGPPTKMPLAMMDILAGHQLKEAILIAIIKQLKTGEGSMIDCSLESSAIASLANQASNYLMANHIPQRMGSLHPNIAPYGESYITKDKRLLVLAIGSDVHFKKLCNLLGKDSLAEDKKYNTNTARVKNRKALNEELIDLFSTHEARYILEKSEEQNIPIGEIKNMEQLFKTKAAQSLILEEEKEDTLTRCVSSIGFKIT